MEFLQDHAEWPRSSGCVLSFEAASRTVSESNADFLRAIPMPHVNDWSDTYVVQEIPEQPYVQFLSGSCP